ncbi:ATP-binding cassette domain-containing protein [Parabacteroides sp. PF5-9]|uniref:ATP-binding cassette domain-containing protein n=1 Tax=Parabacteroides sp. PF5-9 TaxID=1742404 RepID=UPI00247557B5|nr:ATP-binding cassette domain-containing protein [Parabacteroides sp. PF5-9]MDH6359100.1 ABC-type multidrug transport system ATPase subunit [Parabacteroides sp. PF5-9]
MNEAILNGLINLFAIFASLVRIENGQAIYAIHSYLSSHFGVRTQNDYIELYKELRSMYDDDLIPINKEDVVRNICKQMKAKLTLEEQFLLLVRFVEFAHKNSNELENHLHIFKIVAQIFRVSEKEFDDILAFVTGGQSASLLKIDAQEGGSEHHITREGVSGYVIVFFIKRFDLFIFTFHGEGQVFMNDIPLTSGMFYTWQSSSVLKSPLFLPVYYSNLQAIFNKNEHRQTVHLAGRDIQFTFPKSTNGLHNFSFDLESGQLVAIMGGSGVGKSTLLGLMNGNIKPDSGNITVNGHAINSPEGKQLIGFVPQDDLLIEELTVYENLWYTARLSFDGLSSEEIEKRVDKVLAELDLSEIKSLEVGSPIRKTISGGQRKRLNIALELIREPAILYLDEPTSGLSSSDSEKVMILLKEQTHRGRLVVVNIHQPSSEIYKLFDRLWLLDKGGYPIYDGNPIEAITYFKRAAKYTDTDISVCCLCGNVNPELILNIIDSKVIDDSGNPTNIRKFTPEEWHERYLAARPVFKEEKAKTLPDNKQQKPSRWKQFLIYSERNLRRKFANKQYLTIILIEAPLLAIIVSLLTRYVDNDTYTLFANKNFVSYIFMAVIVVTFIGLSISAEEIIKDRIILKRERFLRLSHGSYISAKMVYLFILSGIQTFLFILVGHSIMGVHFDMFPTWWSVLWLTAFLANLTGLWLSQTLSSIVSIYISIPILLIPQILLCGLVVHFDDLNTQASKKNIVPFIGEIIPSRWAFEALMVEQFTANDYNKNFFYIEKEKFLAQYYENAHAKEVRNLVNQMTEKANSPTHQTVINELPVLSRVARIEAIKSDESYHTYLDRIEEALHTRAHNFTVLLEQEQQKFIKEKGQKQFNDWKKANHNLAIEDLVLNTNTTRFFKKSNNRLYPQVGLIYSEPDNIWGRAHFYSHIKKLGKNLISTYKFNLLVLGFFVLLAIIAIFAEFPGRFIRNSKEY